MERPLKQAKQDLRYKKDNCQYGIGRTRQQKNFQLHKVKRQPVETNEGGSAKQRTRVSNMCVASVYMYIWNFHMCTTLMI